MLIAGASRFDTTWPHWDVTACGAAGAPFGLACHPRDGSVKKFYNTTSSACRVEPLEARNLLAADFQVSGLITASSGPASDLLVEAGPPQATPVSTTGDMRHPMPYRGGNRLSFAAPPAPIGVSAVAASSTRVNLAWSDVSGNERGFHIYRSDDGKMFHLIATTRARSTGFADETAVAGKPYLYKVASFNEYGFTMSQAVSVTTPAATQEAGLPAKTKKA